MNSRILLGFIIVSIFYFLTEETRSLYPELEPGNYKLKGIFSIFGGSKKEKIPELNQGAQLQLNRSHNNGTNVPKEVDPDKEKVNVTKKNHKRYHSNY